MNNPLTINLRAAKRLVLVMMAILLAVGSLPLLQPRAGAAQLANRYIMMSDSGPSGTAITTGVGSGTAVTYRLSFDATVAAESFVVDFCEETPLLNAVCTRPVGMTTASGFTAVAGQVTAGNGWAMTNVAGQVKFDNGSGASVDIAAGTQTIDLTGITNPSAVGGFYARITTYTQTGWTNGTSPYVSPANSGGYADYGGIALTTVPTIQVTARVEESLTFCLTTAAHSAWSTNNDCSDPVVSNPANAPNIELGHGSAPVVLDAFTVDRANLYSQISTNASSGAVVRMRNSNTSCGGLSSDDGTTCAIPAHNGGSGAGASALPAGTASFGLFVSDGAVGTGGLLPGGVTYTPSSAYYNAAHDDIVTPDLWYGMESGAGTGVRSTFGSTICSTDGPVHRINTTFVFAATASLTTPAGIYEANLSMIATGTF